MTNFLQSLRRTNTFLSKALILLGLVIIAINLSAQPVSQTFNSSGTYTVPANYKAIVTIEAWGGGGGGNSANKGGGGGGGAYSSISGHTLDAGSYSVTVGGGGAVNTAGGTSSFTTLVVAVGGNGATNGTGAAGGAAASGTGSVKFSGGTGGDSNTNDGGGGGGQGLPGGNGANGSGTTAGGNGGIGGVGNSNAGSGTQPGGGGGGAGTGGSSAGTGGAGQVVVTVTTVLPVVLVSFEAIMNAESVSLNWKTASELNNDKFIIETSTEGEVFNRIGEIDGAGTTTEPQDYTFTHHTPSAGVNYYRLKQVDFDGTFEYSKVIAINAPGSNDIFAFPNPAKDKITLQYDYSKGAGNIQLYDALGRRINASIAGYAGNYEVKLPEGLAKGTYWLKVERGGQVQTVPVVKE